LRKDINLFRAVGDSDIERQPSLKAALSTVELQNLKNVETVVLSIILILAELQSP
jgi:hypothetical protein